MYTILKPINPGVRQLHLTVIEMRNFDSLRVCSEDLFWVFECTISETHLDTECGFLFSLQLGEKQVCPLVKTVGPRTFERFNVRTTWNSRKNSRKIRVWNSKVEQRITWSSRRVEKWRPNIAVVNRSTNLFNDNVMQHFRNILKK
jgi:hypothetical protein